MTDRIRVRRPWLAVLTPSAAALFSTVLVWATGHDPGAAALGTAATTAAPAPGAQATQPTVTPTQDPAAVGRQIAAQEAELGRLAAQLQALRSLGPSSGHTARTGSRGSTGSTGSSASATRPPTYPHLSSGVLSPSRARPASTARPAAPTRTTQPTRAPAPVHTSAPPAPPPIPTPHVTTRSS